MKNAPQVPPQYPQFGELEAMHEAKVKRDVLRAGLVALMRDGFDARHTEVQALLVADESTTLEFNAAVEAYRQSQSQHQPAALEVHVMKNAKTWAVGSFVVSLVDETAIEDGREVQVVTPGTVGLIEDVHHAEGEEPVALVQWLGAPFGTTCRSDEFQVIDAEKLGSNGSGPSKARSLKRLLNDLKTIGTPRR